MNGYHFLITPRIASISLVFWLASLSLLMAVKWTKIEGLIEYFTFALTLSSLILAILAIVYAMFSSASLAQIIQTNSHSATDRPPLGKYEYLRPGRPLHKRSLDKKEYGVTMDSSREGRPDTWVRVTRYAVTHVVLALICGNAIADPNFKATSGDYNADGGVGGPIDVEADKIALDLLWSGFRAALNSGDLQQCAQYFSTDSRVRNIALLELMGPEISSLTDGWSEFTPMDIGEEVAVYALVQAEDSGERVYSVIFVREPGVGWRIQGF